MQVGDKVRHKKLGFGTVKSLYAKNNAARVEYESGHVTVNSQSRLQVVRDIPTHEEHGPPVPTMPDKKRSRGRGAAGATDVDYKRLERCRQAVSKIFPDADHVVPRIHGLRVYAEVWKDGAADIWFWSGD